MASTRKRQVLSLSQFRNKMSFLLRVKVKTWSGGEKQMIFPAPCLNEFKDNGDSKKSRALTHHPRRRSSSSVRTREKRKCAHQRRDWTVCMLVRTRPVGVTTKWWRNRAKMAFDSTAITETTCDKRETAVVSHA